MNLITNRYAQATPTAVTSSGLAISVPVYLNLTEDQNKQMLNAFRELVRKQRIDMGYDDSPKSIGSLMVETKTTPPQTPAEEALGMSVESLRYAIFGKGGTAERLILKLSDLTGVQVVSREEIETVQRLWLDEFYTSTNDRSRTTTTPTSNKGTKRGTKTRVSGSTAKSTAS